MVVFALFGVMFGGLYCTGIRIPDPLRTSGLASYISLAITIIPLMVGIVDFILSTRDMRPFGKVKRITFLMLDLMMTMLLLLIYAPARLSLIVQALALLRNQPSSAFVTVRGSDKVCPLSLFIGYMRRHYPKYFILTFYEPYRIHPNW